MLIFLTGGARSGKSSAAVRWAGRAVAPVVYLATAEVGDDEMAARIARHQAERPDEWTTVEAPRDLEAAVLEVDVGSTLIIDCLSLWVTNLLDTDDAEIVELASLLAATLSDREGLTLVVSNEVGSAVVPDNALARRFRDVLGLVNQTIVDASDRSFLCVAGGAVEITSIDGLITESLDD